MALGAQLGLFASLNFFDDWALEMMPIKFVVAAILSGLAYLLAASEFSGEGTRAYWIFWLVTIGLRLLALPLTPANEVWRYQADGMIQRGGINPYETSPSSFGFSENAQELARVPRNAEPTAYSPGAEILFRAIPAANGVLVSKLIFGAADLLAVVLLLKLVDLRTAAWFAWNPLIAYSFFGAGHFDSIVLLAIVAMILSLTRFEVSVSARSRWSYAFGASFALGIAVSIRPMAIVLLLPAIFALRRHAFALVSAILLPAAAGAVFGIRRTGAWNFFADFPQISRLNDLFWWMTEETVWSNWHQQHYRYDVVIMIVSTLVALLFARNWRRGMLWSLGAVIIFAPVLHAWYVTWILPIATWRRAFAWHFLSVTIFAYYLFFNERLFALPWRAEPWMRGIIILPVVFAMVMLVRQRLSRRQPA
jgi:alpha-1,6-mannosyltransferase